MGLGTTNPPKIACFVAGGDTLYTKRSTIWAHVNANGQMVLPPEVKERYGIEPGARLRLDLDNNTIRLHRPVTHLAKVYVESTNRCNLGCRICMRQTWEEPDGMMSEETFQSILNSLEEFPQPPTIFFGGLGEPLANKRTIQWIEQANKLGGQVEMITNGTLLDKQCAQQLIKAGLDMLWVSIDGATPESYIDVRLGDELPRVIANLSYLRRIRRGGHFPKPMIGIAFVAMKSNIHELPDVISLGRRLGAKRFMVSNVLPYSEETQDEVLYKRTLRNITYLPSPYLPKLSLPRMDLNELTQEAFLKALDSGCNVELADYNLGGANDVCTFIESGAIAINWRGDVSPCPPLSHNHISYLHGYARKSRRHIVGNIHDKNLKTMWLDPEYITYRERVHSYAFAPCTPCGGCDLLEGNEEDCFGLTHPACGSCLWTQGVIQCP
jgi:MoaA/NifB/PqqE/SkfB family radical SAM enzyme